MKYQAQGHHHRGGGVGGGIMQQQQQQQPLGGGWGMMGAGDHHRIVPVVSGGPMHHHHRMGGGVGMGGASSGICGSGGSGGGSGSVVMGGGMIHGGYYVGRHYPADEFMEREQSFKGIGSAMDDSHRNPNKIFVGGLSLDTTTWRLRSYFRQFGKIVDAAVLQDKFTGKSRGFGFCSFADEEAADRCMQQKHQIDGVPVEVRKALPRSEAAALQHHDDVDQNCKIFVGGIPMETTEAQLVEHFEKFGKVKNAILMYDRVTNKQRGFAFVIFESPDDADRAVGEHQFLDSTIESKKAEPREAAPVSRRRRMRDYSDHYGNRYAPYRYGNYYDRDYSPCDYGYRGPSYNPYREPTGYSRNYGSDMYINYPPRSGSMHPFPHDVEMTNGMNKPWRYYGVGSATRHY